MHSDEQIIKAYVDYFCQGGSKSDYWAVDELYNISLVDPFKTWKIIKQINEYPVKDIEWRKHMLAGLGCGALENIIVLHTDKIFPEILKTAETDQLLKWELGLIYESSVSREIWIKLKALLGNSGIEFP